ncbi:CFI-box-CTERM domain-containing protein [Paracidovorax anthurii]|uniref:CFI-box-CTERM domain-containing protein n=1 Tax=Paracidovorax anthurii TaxID=78229 RepID=UPI001FE25B25|nr:CFI-box-CTERM domain-containing protein [Paracidovorax anthurii]
MTATELAAMGYCEKKVQLAHLYGQRTTPEQRKAMARGRQAHQRYFEQGVASASDRRCFVATFVFGPEAVETQVLRTYRDRVLLHRRWGRWVVAVYYWVGPAGCWILGRSPALARGVRLLLRIVVVWCRIRIDAGRWT